MITHTEVARRLDAIERMLQLALELKTTPDRVRGLEAENDLLRRMCAEAGLIPNAEKAPSVSQEPLEIERDG